MPRNVTDAALNLTPWLVAFAGGILIEVIEAGGGTAAEVELGMRRLFRVLGELALEVLPAAVVARTLDVALWLSEVAFVLVHDNPDAQGSTLVRRDARKCSLLAERVNRPHDLRDEDLQVVHAWVFDCRANRAKTQIDPSSPYFFGLIGEP